MATPLSICIICGDPHMGAAKACDDCAQYERVTNSRLARMQRRIKRLSVNYTSAEARALRCDLARQEEFWGVSDAERYWPDATAAQLRRYEQGGA